LPINFKAHIIISTSPRARAFVYSDLIPPIPNA